MINQTLAFHNHLSMSTSGYYAYFYCHITPRTIVSSLPLEIITRAFKCNHNREQFQKPHNKFRNLILKIL